LAIVIGLEGAVADHDCIHEADVVAAVLSRRWDRANDELKQHAADCDVCRDVVAVASVLAADQEQARYEVRVPAAGQVWWRAAVRARLEAAHAVERPLTWLHGIAGACAVGVACAVIGMAWPTLREIASWFTLETFRADSRVADVAAFVTDAMQRSLPLAFVVAACIVLAPVALYFALSDD
jgi:hypothetical protein